MIRLGKMTGKLPEMTSMSWFRCIRYTRACRRRQIREERPKKVLCHDTQIKIFISYVIVTYGISFKINKSQQINIFILFWIIESYISSMCLVLYLSHIIVYIISDIFSDIKVMLQLLYIWDIEYCCSYIYFVTYSYVIWYMIHSVFNRCIWAVT